MIAFVHITLKRNGQDAQTEDERDEEASQVARLCESLSDDTPVHVRDFGLRYLYTANGDEPLHCDTCGKGGTDEREFISSRTKTGKLLTECGACDDKRESADHRSALPPVPALPSKEQP